MTKKTADINVTGGGSIFLLAPQTPAGRNWIDQHIGKDNGHHTDLSAEIGRPEEVKA